MDERLVDNYMSSVQALWPGEPEPRLRRGRGSGRSSSTDDVEFLVLPNADTPRILVPADNPAAAARAMLRFSASLSAPDTVKRLVVSSLLRARTDVAFPDRIMVQERAGSLRRHLGDVFGEPVDFSLGLGTARANRKAVLQVFDARGRSLAFVKIGGTEVTDALVRAEAAALQQLGGVDLSEVLEVPRLLHLGVWEGASLVAMTALETSFRQRPSRQFSLPLEEMSMLHRAFAESARPLVELALWGSMCAAHASLSPSAARDRLGEALDTLREIAADRSLEVGAWHGDWSPWNMSRRRDRIQLWDWERFETGVPLGMDRCHYGVNAVSLRDGVSVSSVMKGFDLARVGNDRSSESHVIGATYLATVACRYLVGAESELGDAIAERSLVTLDALLEWLGLPVGVSRG